MIPLLKQAATTHLLLFALATLFSISPSIAQNPTSPPAQTPVPPQPQIPKPPLTVPFTPQPKPIPRTLILLDPAHGGTDTGARLPNNLLEKDITLTFATRLRAALSAANFAVISTRTTDPATLFTTDQRAEIANHDRASVCLILHATSTGSGIHLFTSSLTPPASTARPTYLLHWNTAQIPSIPTSRSLANEIGLSLLQSKLPIILSQSSLPPLNNLTCPAIAIELAPLTTPNANPTPVSDAAYQQRAAEAIAAALTTWRTNNAADGAAR